MATTKPALNQFNGGEIAPWLEGRFDLPKYHYSARVMKDFVPLSEGGVKRRGGSHYVKPIKEVDALLFKINTTPEDATIYINNNMIDQLYVAPGDKVGYSVSHEGYQTVSGDIKIEEDTTLDIKLLSLSKRNKLTIKPIPEDATVYINGVEGNELEVLHRSVVEYMVIREGFDTYRGSVQIIDDMTITVEMTMSFVINVVQHGAKVVINGVERSSISVETGDVVEWSVSKEGYVGQSGSQVIDGAVSLQVNLAAIYEQNETVFEQTLPGKYIINLKTKGFYRLAKCGAGGGAGGSSGAHAWMGGVGGGGAAFSGKCFFEAGQYVIFIGAGGIGGSGSGRNALPGALGFASYIEKDGNRLITCGAGDGGHGTGNWAPAGTGKGGKITMGTLQVQSYSIQKDGKDSSSSSLLNNGFGGGGVPREGNSGTNGTGGYVKLVYVGQV